MEALALKADATAQLDSLELTAVSKILAMVWPAETEAPAQTVDASAPLVS